MLVSVFSETSERRQVYIRVTSAPDTETSWRASLDFTVGGDVVTIHVTDLDKLVEMAHEIEEQARILQAELRQACPFAG